MLRKKNRKLYIHLYAISNMHALYLSIVTFKVERRKKKIRYINVVKIFV